MKTENQITRTSAVGWLLLVFVLGFSPTVCGPDGSGSDSRVISLAEGFLEWDSAIPSSTSESFRYQEPIGRKRQTSSRAPVALDFEPDSENDFLIAPPGFETLGESMIRPRIRRGAGNLVPLLARSRSDFSRAPPLLQG